MIDKEQKEYWDNMPDYIMHQEGDTTDSDGCYVEAEHDDKRYSLPRVVMRQSIEDLALKENVLHCNINVVHKNRDVYDNRKENLELRIK